MRAEPEHSGPGRSDAGRANQQHRDSSHDTADRRLGDPSHDPANWQHSDSSHNPANRQHRDPWHDLADRQHGVVSRSQLLALGLTASQARRHIANGRWQLIVPGVYATFTGQVSDLATVCAAVLYAGPGAAASHATALWLAGVIDDRPNAVDVSISATRRVAPQSGIRIRRTRAPTDSVHPAALPPRIRVEVALLDHLDVANAETVVDLILRATQRRITTAERLRNALAARPRHRHRSLLNEVLTDVEAGVQSPLERRYLRDVERGHRLPKGSRNDPERNAGTSNRYRDVRYKRWSVIVELDGRAAHPAERAFRDHRRDNAAAVAGEVVLRYGWRDVVRNPCQVAAEVSAVLQSRGWRGTPTPCGPGCSVHRAA